MYFFDLHCDTVCEMEKQSKSLFDNDLAISLKKASNIDRWVQTFAIFIHDKFADDEKRMVFEKQNFVLKNEIEKNSLQSFSVDNKSDISIIKSIENASFINDDLDYIEILAKEGFRLATLTWNAQNVYAGGAESDEGISSLGKEAVKRFNECSITLDVSHLSDKSFYDLVKISDKPFIASHSNARAVCNRRRNLTDDMLLEIADRGGVVGLNFYTLFLAEEKPKKEDILRHAEHIIKLCGENILAIGSDFDGADMPDDLKSIEDIEILYQLMVQYFGKQLTDKIFFENACSFFKRVSNNYIS